MMIRCILFIVIIFSCDSKNKKMSKLPKEYQELHQHVGTPSYEVVTVIDRNLQIDYRWIDTKGRILSFNAYQKTNEPYWGKCEKISILGQVIDTTKVNAILGDGYMINFMYYSTWLLDGNQEKKNYVEPVTEREQQNQDKWFEKFREYYDNASYVYENINNGRFYMNVNGKYHIFENTFIGAIERATKPWRETSGQNDKRL